MIYYDHISVAIVSSSIFESSFLKTLLKGLSVLSFQKTLSFIDLFVLSIYYFISALIFVIPFLLLILGLIWFSFSTSLMCKVRLYVWNLSFFFNVEIYYYKLPSWNCFCCILYLLVYCIFIFICKIFLNFIWSMLFNFHTFMNFPVSRNVTDF